MIEKHEERVGIRLEISQGIQILHSEIKNQHVYGRKLSKTETKLR